MKISTPFFLLLPLLLVGFHAFAQNKLCGSDALFLESISNNPEAQKSYQELEDFTATFIENQQYQRDSHDVKIIPIVFHIIHNYGSENISKEQIVDAVRVINEDFRKLNPDSADMVLQFQGIAADAHIEFRLARIDPDGQCTEGITRTVSNFTFNAGENVKSLVSWDTKKYLNVWVVDDIAIEAGAYAYFPGTAPGEDNEGIVNSHGQLGSIGTSNGSNFATRTLTHEIGHYLNLPHVWGFGANNNPNACNGDDGVADTPNCIGSPQLCDLDRTTCGSLDNVENYMDYASCAKMFTEGQALRMLAALNSTAGGRLFLWQESNLIATGTNDGFVNQCAPIPDFVANTNDQCEGQEVEFRDLSYNAVVDNSWTWSWQFEGGIPSTSSLQNPTVLYNSPGNYSVTLTVSNASGSNTLTKSHFIRINPTSGGESAPFFEDMESTSFPSHPTQPLKDWSLQGTFPETIERTTDVSFMGSACLRVDNFITDNITRSLVSPPIDLGQLAPEEATLSFRMAYAKRNATSSDALQVYVSDDCGQDWTLRYSNLGDGLATNGGFNETAPFIPDNNEFRLEEAIISDFAGKVIYLKFDFTSGNGNYIYLDNINIGGFDVGVDRWTENSVRVRTYPNPFASELKIEYFLESRSEVALYLLDPLGKKIADVNLGTQNPGNQSFKANHLISDLAHSFYFLQLSVDGKVSTRIVAHIN